MRPSYPAYWIYLNDEGKWGWKFALSEGVFLVESPVHYRTQQECANAIQLLRQAKNLTVFATVDDLTSIASTMASGTSTPEEQELILGQDDSLDYRGRPGPR